MFRLYNNTFIPWIDCSDILMYFVGGKFLMYKIREYGIYFDKISSGDN